MCSFAKLGYQVGGATDVLTGVTRVTKIGDNYHGYLPAAHYTLYGLGDSLSVG
jgi:hypothetical protein